MKYFDSHCHLDLEPLFEELEGVVEKSSKAGVVGMINVGTSLRSSQRSIEIANLYPNIWATVGLHPHESEEVFDSEGAITELKELAENDQVVAIGEIGLDYFHPEKRITEDQKKKQREIFEGQLKIAKELSLPVVIHSRDAETDILSILNKNKGIKGAVHCFSGDKDYARKLLDLGLFIGFTGFITFEQEKFNQIREAVKIVPAERLLIETDAPFLAPEPYRGKVNEPAFVVEIAKKVAELKGISVAEVAKKTLENACRLFSLTIN